MEALIASLLPLYQRERDAGRDLALAIVVHTIGSTYRKPGALMAIAADGSYAGLLSGGCLETDLRDHALKVIETGQARTVTYDTRGTDDILWGLGIGCEGAMQILLLRVGRTGGWQPLAHLSSSLDAHRRTTFGVVIEPAGASLPLGSVLLQGQDAQVDEALARAASSGRTETTTLRDGTRVVMVPLALPPRLLLLGGGPDAQPLVDLAARLAWKVTVYDHRPAYAQSEHFSAGAQVVLGHPRELTQHVDLAAYDAAVVMSHHLPSDLEYLRLLSASPIGYLGLLGPPARRERLLADLPAEANSLRGRLRSPVGLDLGGRTPESVALSVVAEIHAHLNGRRGGPYDDAQHDSRAAERG